MTNLEWLKGVIAMTNFEWLEWIKNLPEEELIRELSTVYNKDWLNAKHLPKVKTCANCGGKPIVDRNQNSVSCADCGMATPWTDSIEDAIKTWNRRVNNE